MMLGFYFCLFICFLTFEGYIQCNPKVKTSLGTLRGFYDKSKRGRTFYAFEGVPYAKAPVGNFRFREPADLKPWPGVWTANTVHKCMQLIRKSKDIYHVIGDEDCLYLNIYSPILSRTANMKVIVYIHGGMFMKGCASDWRSNTLMDKDIVLVTINYRLGPLGFFSTNDPALPGNMGLYDQIKALQWIKEHIVHFGGSSSSITIAGEEAGAASVHFHYIASNYGTDLFHRGMAFSGTALNFWSLSKQTIKNSFEISKIMGCESSTTNDMVDCMKRRPAKQIVDCSKYLIPDIAVFPYSPFGVVVSQFTTENNIFPSDPYLSVLTRKVKHKPLLFSNTENDGLYYTSGFVVNLDAAKNLSINWNGIIPHVLGFDKSIQDTDRNVTSQNIKDFYFQDKPVNLHTFPIWSKVVSDRLFLSFVEQATKMQATSSYAPIYHYLFSYRGNYSRVNDEFTFSTGRKLGEVLGPSLGDDVKYVLNNENLGEEDQKMSENLLEMWMCFVNSGSPCFNGHMWSPVSSLETSTLETLQIYSPNNFTFEEVTDLGSRTFWESLPIKENKKIFVSKEEL